MPAFFILSTLPELDREQSQLLSSHSSLHVKFVIQSLPGQQCAAISNSPNLFTDAFVCQQSIYYYWNYLVPNLEQFVCQQWIYHYWNYLVPNLEQEADAIW